MIPPIGSPVLVLDSHMVSTMDFFYMQPTSFKIWLDGYLPNAHVEIISLRIVDAQQ